MATEELATERLRAPSGGVQRPSDDGDDEELLLYLYEKSSDSRARCYDCISMGGLVRGSRDASDTDAGSDRELISRSTEQICSKALSLAGSASAAGAQVPGVVRSCRSQENYFDLSDMICVDIDLDENLASSVDALHYRESFVSRTSDSSGSVETVELESGDQGIAATTPDDNKVPDEMVQETSSGDLNSVSTTPVIKEPPQVEDSQSSSAPSLADVDELDGGDDGKINDDVSTSIDEEGELQGRTCLKDADRPSAGRLAKRLYYLDGFRKTDVSPHLSKKSASIHISVVRDVSSTRTTRV